MTDKKIIIADDALTMSIDEQQQILAAPAFTTAISNMVETIYVDYRWTMLPIAFDAANNKTQKHPTTLGTATHPVTVNGREYKGWKEFQQREPTLAEYKYWFHVGDTQHPNYCVITGRRSGVVVLDMDNADARTWVDSHCPKPVLSVHRAPDHWHYYYRYPQGIEWTIGNKAGLVKGLDIRADGGLVVGPLSIHHKNPDGTYVRYEPLGDWDDKAAWLQSEPFNPEWLGLEKKVVAVSNYVPAAVVGSIGETSTGRWYLEHGHTVESGYRNAKLFVAACDHQAVGISIDDARNALVPIAVASGLSASEAESAINSAYSQPRTATVTNDMPNSEWNTFPAPRASIEELSEKYGRFTVYTPQESAQLAANLGGSIPIMKNVIHKGLTTILVGGPKVGKSELLYNIIARSNKARKAAAPVEYLNTKVYAAKWCVITEEPAVLVPDHFIDHDLWDNDLMLNYANDIGALKSMRPELQRAHMEKVMVPMLRSLGVDVVVFDTVMGCLNIDLNKGPEVASMFQFIKRTFAEFAIVLLMHTRKQQFSGGKPVGSDKEQHSGNQQVMAQADVAALLRWDKDEHGPTRILKFTGRLDVPSDMVLMFDVASREYSFSAYLHKEDAEFIQAKASAKDDVYPLTGDTWVKATALTELLHPVSPRTVNRALKSLADEGYLVSRTVTGRGNPTEYKRTDKVFITSKDITLLTTVDDKDLFIDWDTLI